MTVQSWYGKAWHRTESGFRKSAFVPQTPSWCLFREPAPPVARPYPPCQIEVSSCPNDGLRLNPSWTQSRSSGPEAQAQCHRAGHLVLGRKRRRLQPASRVERRWSHLASRPQSRSHDEATKRRSSRVSRGRAHGPLPSLEALAFIAPRPLASWYLVQVKNKSVSSASNS